MEASRRVLTRPVVSVAALVAAGLLAGCSGSPSLPASPGTTQLTSSFTHSGVVSPDACKSNGGVRATPCRVVLSASNSTVAVSLRTPQGSKGSVVEHDNCGGASGIATISGSYQTWTVTAGSMAGSCKARFNYFNNNQLVGWAKIKIQNTI